MVTLNLLTTKEIPTSFNPMRIDEENMKTKGDLILLIQDVCENNKSLVLAFLIGSQSKGTNTSNSDWDIALQWHVDMKVMQQLAQTEKLRNQIAKVLTTPDTKVDLINIPTAGLAMREVIVNEGKLLKGENTVVLSHFLLRTWRQLEEYYWDTIYAT